MKVWRRTHYWTCWWRSSIALRYLFVGHQRYSIGSPYESHSFWIWRLAVARKRVWVVGGARGLAVRRLCQNEDVRCE
jgi:hypothetical protein